MEPTRSAARSLARENKIKILQKGQVLTNVEEFKGPIRLQILIVKKGDTSEDSSSLRVEI